VAWADFGWSDELFGLGVYAAGDNARAMHNATFASADGVLAGASLHQALMLDPLTA